MNDLRPGTPCFLVRLRDFPSLNGRVVEVIESLPAPADEGEFYAVRSDWITDFFAGHDVCVLRGNLYPINPPTPAAHTHTATDERCTT